MLEKRGKEILLKKPKMKKVAIIGATGNGLFIAEMINQCFNRRLTDFYCMGFVDDFSITFSGYPIISKFSGIPKLIKNNYYFITAISVDSRQGRKELYNSLHLPLEKMCSFTHPSAFISSNVIINKGVIIGPNVSINTNTIIEENVRIMPNVSIGAYCKIGKHSFLSVNSCLSDNCEIGDGCHIGLSSGIAKGIKIGDSSLVGMGAFVECNINSNEIWVGNPAKYLKKRY